MRNDLPHSCYHDNLNRTYCLYHQLYPNEAIYLDQLMYRPYWIKDLTETYPLSQMTLILVYEIK